MPRSPPSWIRCQVKDTAVRLTWKLLLCLQLLTYKSSPYTQEGLSSGAKPFIYFFTSLTFIRSSPCRRTPGTNLSLGDKLQELLQQLCKQTVCEPRRDFGFNLEEHIFKNKPLSCSVPLSSQINQPLKTSSLGPTLCRRFGASPITAPGAKLCG